ncbi:hypothetical protein BDP67DRAFT_60924 [Colletotrichum lupini]|nr:hypothetical protein BDP67DRAFT_60924 [Colletotrichum lupini]
MAGPFTQVENCQCATNQPYSGAYALRRPSKPLSLSLSLFHRQPHRIELSNTYLAPLQGECRPLPARHSAPSPLYTRHPYTKRDGATAQHPPVQQLGTRSQGLVLATAITPDSVTGDAMSSCTCHGSGTMVSAPSCVRNTTNFSADSLYPSARWLWGSSLARLPGSHPWCFSNDIGLSRHRAHRFSSTTKHRPSVKPIIVRTASASR